jgi:aspartyl-tRNA(Asn)/glutamyl-tRNA(Gln) amidotransferase subunit A
MAAPYELTATQAVTAMKEGSLSPVRLLEACFAQIDRLEPKIQAFVTFDRERALETAHHREKDLEQGKHLGLLHGVPIAVKDVFYTKGVLTTACSRVYENFIPDYDAAAVASLKNAGAVIVGKTWTTELASGDTGPTRNPYNLEHTPGGSSQGSGAAVGARMVPAALGTQTVGSTLRPASFNGCVGLKPTYGRISRHGVITLAWTLDHVGIIVRSVEDAALLLQVMAGHDDNDPSTSECQVDDYVAQVNAQIKRPRVGFIRDFFMGDECDKEIRRHTEGVVQKLAQAGADVEEVRLPESFASARAAERVIYGSEIGAFHEKVMRRDPDLFRPSMRSSVQVGLLIPASYYLQAQRLRSRFRKDMDQVIARYDALMTPTTPTPAPKGLASAGSAIFQSPWSFSGLPTLSVPSGLTESRLPLGIQLISRPFAEGQLLQVGRWCERALDIQLYPPVSAISRH